LNFSAALALSVRGNSALISKGLRRGDQTVPTGLFKRQFSPDFKGIETKVVEGKYHVEGRQFSPDFKGIETRHPRPARWLQIAAIQP